MTDTRAEFERATVDTIKEEDLERDRLAVGIDVPSIDEEWLATATPEAIRNFARSYGDPNPLWCDRDYGRSTRWGSQIAPPMMTYQLNEPLRAEAPDPRARGG